MKIISWNVNGLRAVLGKGFLDFVGREEPDILCLQEIKAHREQVDEILENYENHFWNSAEKKGYSGTAVFSKIKPLSVGYGKELMDDEEGRVILLEFEDFYLVNVYTPNSQRGLTRLVYRLEWDKRFFNFLKNLEEKKKVIVCGDLNVAHKEIDLKNPKQNEMNAGFTMQERDSFDNYLKNGFVDVFREFCKEEGNYTWWSYMFNARERDIGWRIDYFLASKELLGNIKESQILKDVMGSDHCPVLLELSNL
ncbi:MAG: exodeoxyribonuclease III [Candidatus Pacearchaeota archaeon]|nr:exodeoxyribonuclease III [Candidatus Pacearchaeota archaeon]